MFYEISWVYFIIPIFCLIFFKSSKNKIIYILLFLLLFLLLFCSKNGSDYPNYLLQYKMLEQGYSVSSIHGEILFKKYMKLYQSLGIEYQNFRILHLTFFGGIIYFSIVKISKNIFLSTYILYCGYIIYLISTYRQLVSISFLFLGIYFWRKKKLKIAIILNLLGIYFHISSIWVLLLFFCLYIKAPILYIKNRITILIILIFCIIFRYLVLKIPLLLEMIASIFGREEHLRFYLNYGMNFLEFGVLTRIIPIIFIIIVYKKIEKIREIANFYIISGMFYILIPIKLIAGRIFNNGRVLEVIIFPFLYYSMKKNRKIFILFFITFYYLLTLIFQLLKQDGYYPYINILLY